MLRHLLLLLFVCLTTPAQAQSVSGLLDQVRSGSLPGDILDPEVEQRAIETATRAFGHSATRKVDRLLLTDPDASEETRQALREIAATSTERFRTAARNDLIDAKGDGLVTAKELAAELTEVRQDELDRLVDELEAAMVGVEAPPDPAEFARSGQHAQAMARYIVVQRNPVSRWLLLLASVVAVLSVVGLLGRLSRALAEQAESGSAWMRWVYPVRGPVVLTAFSLGAWAGLGPLWLPSAADAVLAGLLHLSLGVAGAWAAWRLADPVARQIPRAALRNWEQAQEELADILRKGLRLLTLMAFLVFVAQQVLGADLQTLLASVGLIGLAASVAAQDTLRNLLGSITLHSDRPFQAGDLIRFDEHFGHVEEIGFRSTTLRTLDGPVVVIPNAELVQREVQNVSRRKAIRHHYSLAVVYGTPEKDLEKALDIVREVLDGNSARGVHEPTAVLHALGEHSLQIKVWYHSDTSDYWEAMRHRGEVNQTLLYRLREAGLEFAFPTQTVFVADEEGEAARDSHSNEGGDAEGGAEEPADPDAEATEDEASRDAA